MPDSGISDGSTFTSAFWDDYVREQVVCTCTSATRPTAVEGRCIYETDTDRLLVHDGSAWQVVAEPPQTWSVTSITQSTSKSCTTTYGWYQRHRGKFDAQITLTGFAAGTAGNDITIATPLTLPDLEALGGSFTYFDSGSTVYAGTCTPASTTTFKLQVDGNASPLGTTPSIAVASADVLRLTIHGRY